MVRMMPSERLILGCQPNIFFAFLKPQHHLSFSNGLVLFSLHITLLLLPTFFAINWPTSKSLVLLLLPIFIISSFAFLLSNALNMASAASPTKQKSLLFFLEEFNWMSSPFRLESIAMGINRSFF